MTYDFLQHYWWFLIALLGALLVFLMFVQGANSMIFQLGKTDVERRMVHDACNVWRSVLCFVPIVLQYQLRIGLLGVDYHSFLVHHSSRQLRVSEQGG